MSHSSIEAYLSQFINLERTGEFKYARDLTRMRRLLTALDSPEKDLRIRLIAGSKGKTSTSYYLSRLLQSSDRNIGLYISPHLTEWNERIQVNGTPAATEKILALIPQIQTAIENMHGADRPTYFEITTALAFLYFKTEKILDAVMEVGLGGRYDATNVCHPVLSVITPISLEHTAVLGNTLLEIAHEKFGVWRRGTPMIIGKQSAEVLEDYKKILNRESSPAHYSQAVTSFIKRDGGLSGTEFNLMGPWGQIRVDNPAFVGKFQIENLLTSLLSAWNDPYFTYSSGNVFVDEMESKISDMQSVPGRLHLLRTNPLILVDGSHNAASAEVMAEAIQQRWNPSSVSLIVAMMRDKDPVAYIKKIQHLPIKQIIVTSTHHNRSYTAKELAQKIESVHDVQVAETLQAAISMCDSLNESSHMLLICGSLYLAGEAIKSQSLICEGVRSDG